MKNVTRKPINTIMERSGFSLVEMMVVLVILGILAASVGVYINTADSKLKTFVFNQKSQFNMARFEAVKRGLDVYIDFDEDNGGSVDNGYTVWVDADGSGAPYNEWNAGNDNNGNGQCDAGDAGDCLISTVQFDNILNGTYGRHGPEIYNPATSSGGPVVGNGPGGSNIGDGVAVNAERFRFSPSGDAIAGSLYLYYPEGPAAAKRVKSGPWAIIVASTGRIRIDRWGNVKANDWDVD